MPLLVPMPMEWRTTDLMWVRMYVCVCVVGGGLGLCKGKLLHKQTHSRVHVIHVIFSREMAHDQKMTFTAFHVDLVRIIELVVPNINFLKEYFSRSAMIVHFTIYLV